MHYQIEEGREAKLIRCTRGVVFDVLIDLRPESKTFKRWISLELSADNRKMVYVPEGFAHGFQTLADDTELFYQMSVCFAPQYARGVRWNDPCFAVAWPQPVPSLISDKDQQYPDYNL